jgi:hypothetical protein
MVDTNLQMIEETCWLLSANKLSEIIPLHGLVGANGTGEEADFYLLPSNLGSSQYPVYEPGKPAKGEWKRTTMPRIDLGATRSKHFGNLRCHLLKVGIEGSEGTLLKTEAEFLRRVDLLVLEWHKWIVSRESIEDMLRSQGFALVEVLQESKTTGIGWYKRATQ